MIPNKKWLNKFKQWQIGECDDANISLLLKRSKRLGIDSKLIQDCLAEINPLISKEYLDPELLPIQLLIKPNQWDPAKSGINWMALQNHHKSIKIKQQLIASGLLNEILDGKQQLYEDLPAIPIKAYQDGLKKRCRLRCKQNNWSIFEHLVNEGWNEFKCKKEVALGFDRYNYLERPALNTKRFLDQRLKQLLVVVGGNEDRAREMSLGGGWNYYLNIEANPRGLYDLKLQSKNYDLVSLVSCTDELREDSKQIIAEINWEQPTTCMITSDEALCWNKKKFKLNSNRQNKGYITPFRLLTRCCVGGLVSVKGNVLSEITFRETYNCFQALVLDIAFHIFNMKRKVYQCQEVLLFRSSLNPTVPDQGWPMERMNLNKNLQHEFLDIVQLHSRNLISDQGFVEKSTSYPGCHIIKYYPQKKPRISIIIPYRDNVELTRKCLNSIRQYASTSLEYEIIFVNNGSKEPETTNWANQQKSQKNIKIITIDEPFNFSRLSNLGRKECQGEYLLFLNNDIEFTSGNTLDELLHPFAYHQTSAVGSRLHYPDGSIQHNGVIIVKGERRCVIEPGKHLSVPKTVDSLTPLNVQEEFSAASAACLMVKANDFDAVGGFDESLAVVFNDVDLCLKLRQRGGVVVVTPYPRIIHHESVSRGKDIEGVAYARHQKESGYLRRKHQNLFIHGDELSSRYLEPHSTRYEPKQIEKKPLRPARANIIDSWRRAGELDMRKPILFFAQYEQNINHEIRADIIQLLKEYRKYCNIVVIASTPSFIHKKRTLKSLQRVSDILIIRENEGYDFGGWMTGLSFCRTDVIRSQEIILTNDSFWGPITPLKELFERINGSSADMIALTDDLMYYPHLTSPFTVYRKNVIDSQIFSEIWDNIQVWEQKRDIVKQYEVGISVKLKSVGFKLKSLYSHHANGNLFHTEWRQLIEDQRFPFIKVSLLRDNPSNQNIDCWEEIIKIRNPKLSKMISKQLALWKQQ